MDKQTCPYCGKNAEHDQCEYCNQVISEYSEEKKNHYDFNMAILLNDTSLINEIGSKLPNSRMTNYYIAYVNNKDIDYTVFEDKELLEIADHQKDLANVINHIKNKNLLEAKNNFDVNHIEKVDILYEQPENRDRQDGKVYIMVGLVMIVLVILLSLLITKRIRVHYLTLLLVVPSLILSNGILKFIKYSKIKMAAITFLSIFLFGYIGSIYMNTDLINHFENMMLSLFYIFKYYVEKGAVR